MKESAATLEPVEWVSSHLEAHGQLLVHGASLEEIVTRATAAIHGRQPGVVRIRVIHPGWWCTTPCRCRPALASSNHPAWHYQPARSGDEGAWYGAEVRFRYAS